MSCSKHCPASAYTDLLPANPVLKTDHNHCPEPVKLEVDRCRTEMRMVRYRNVLLPKCMLPKRPLPKCPLHKYLDTVCACICVRFSLVMLPTTLSIISYISRRVYLRNRVLIVCAHVMLCTARISFLLSGAAKISHNAVSLSFRISQQGA